MKNTFGFLLIAMLLVVACDKDDESESTTWKNALTFGTGTDGTNFTLDGESTTFPAGTIYFRLESKEDMAGSPVRIVITDLSTGEVLTYDYPVLQNYGHIYLSALVVPTSGSYRATGILTTGNITVASINLTITD